ncbi:MAG: SRPBCC domain-containing protein [Pseudomonadota bacterium]
MTHDFETMEVRREIAARPETVFRLWTDPALKEAWFVTDNGPEWSASSYEGSLAEGGTERVIFRHAEKGSFTITPHMLIAEAPRRVIYVYRMDHGPRPITASVVTIALTPRGTGTALVLTEQITFLDGGGSLETRLPGTEYVVGKMARAAEAAERSHIHVPT